MSDVEHISIVKHVPLDTIDSSLADMGGSSDNASKRGCVRLLFVKMKYLGYSTVEASKHLGITVQTGYNWLKSWNCKGMDSILPHFSGGRKTELSEIQMIMLGLWVSMFTPTTREVMEYIRNLCGVEYTLTHIQRILTKMGLIHRADVGGNEMRWFMN